MDGNGNYGRSESSDLQPRWNTSFAPAVNSSSTVPLDSYNIPGGKVDLKRASKKLRFRDEVALGFFVPV